MRLARFVIRPFGGRQRGGDLLIGSLYKGVDKSPHPDLQPGVIYEIVEILGVLVIQPLGPAAIGSDRNKSKLKGFGGNWTYRIDQIVNAGIEWIFTREEADRENYDHHG